MFHHFIKEDKKGTLNEEFGESISVSGTNPDDVICENNPNAPNEEVTQIIDYESVNSEEDEEGSDDNSNDIDHGDNEEIINEDINSDIKPVDKTKRSVSFDMTYVDDDKPKLFTFQEVVEAAKRLNTEYCNENMNDDRPSTCIPIITIDHVTEPDIYAKQNREPTQTRHRDSVTGLVLQRERTSMHLLSVPSRRIIISNEARKPGGCATGAHPAFGPPSGKKYVRKTLGVKRIQYLIDKRQKKEKKREERRKYRTKQKWIDADRMRVAHESAVAHRNSTVAWK